MPLLALITVYVNHNLFIWSSVWGHLGSFQFFEIMCYALCTIRKITYYNFLNFSLWKITDIH